MKDMFLNIFRAMYQNPHLTPQLKVALSANISKYDLSEKFANNKIDYEKNKCPYDAYLKEEHPSQFYARICQLLRECIKVKWHY